MQPLGPSAHRLESADPGDAAIGSQNRVVLPRLLRKPVRHAKRFLSGGVRVSRRGVLLSAALAGLVAGGFYLDRSGVAGAWKAQAADALGIVVARYRISGNREVPDTEIVAMIAADPADTIFGYDVEAARERLRAHPWISEAMVARNYPDTITIDVTETRPFAVWQAPDGLKLIGKDGAVLADYDGNRRGLPLIVGPGANSAAAAMLSLMQRYPEISAQTRALVRVGERRWDLELGNGAGSVVVMLPEKGYPEEVARLAELIARQGLLDRDVTRIDMRMADRMVIRMSEEGGELVRARRADQIKHLTSARRERNT